MGHQPVYRSGPGPGCGRQASVTQCTCNYTRSFASMERQSRLHAYADVVVVSFYSGTVFWWFGLLLWCSGVYRLGNI